MTASVQEMKGQIAVLGGLEEEAARKELLVRLYLQLQFLSRSADLPELRPAFELCCALEGLLKKLKDDSKRATASALRTAAAGVDLLQDVSVPGLRPDLASNPPVRILVVDDEPVARRAITGAMQMAFPRPVGADSGETAVGLAVEKEFDLVFLDVCMPVMDGFTVCSKIHETTLNRSTPVVFITSLSDEGFRAQSALCGGSDYVVKPFVFMEITVKALTFVLRGRLEKLRKAAGAEHDGGRSNHSMQPDLG
jgi:PleD family two-component response regulator